VTTATCISTRVLQNSGVVVYNVETVSNLEKVFHFEVELGRLLCAF